MGQTTIAETGVIQHQCLDQDKLKKLAVQEQEPFEMLMLIEQFSNENESCGVHVKITEVVLPGEHEVCIEPLDIFVTDAASKAEEMLSKVITPQLWWIWGELPYSEGERTIRLCIAFLPGRAATYAFIGEDEEEYGVASVRSN